MSKPTFRTFVKEADKKKDTEVARVRDRQAAEKSSLKKRQDYEVEKARERDFQKSQDERDKKRQDSEDAKRAKDSAKNESLEVEFESLEVGTDKIVATFKKDVPGQ